MYKRQIEDTVKAAIERSFLYRFDKLKRGQYYEKGNLPLWCASIFDRDIIQISRDIFKCVVFSSDLSIIKTDSSYSYAMFCSDWLC